MLSGSEADFGRARRAAIAGLAQEEAKVPMPERLIRFHGQTA